MSGQADLCGRCHDTRRAGNSTMCHDCLADNAAKATKTKALRGIESGHHKLYRAMHRLAVSYVCPDCGEAVTRAHATLHAWTAHHRVVPVEDMPDVFRPVTP